MGGIFKSLRDKLLKKELPYRRMFLIIDLSIDADTNHLHRKLIDSEKDIDLHKKEILSTIKVPAVNNAVYMMNKGDYFVISEYNILDDLKFIDYIEFNMDYSAEDKNSFRILCKNYITDYGKIIFMVDSIMIYNNNVNIILKLVRPDKIDDQSYIKNIQETDSKFVKYEYSKN
ncbi:hypothetical protein [Chryseobacterium sp. LC2016-29]|uniref:hypothetical protein n=1 Tax=Chryseobacterium sp. LC2016-29 TaxID=2897331 RepID=UPI001E5F375C|nr:hypothetical protein [Chryseobacterium sp. LC2016-29]